jgi:hypothetical protein
MTSNMVQAASYPPLQKAQGRGTQNSGTGRTNTKGGHPPEDEIALPVQFFKTLDEWDREYKDSQFAARESQTGFQREAV